MFGTACKEIQEFQYLLPGHPLVTVSLSQLGMRVTAHWSDRSVKDVYVVIDSSKMKDLTWETFVDEFLVFFSVEYAKQKKAYRDANSNRSLSETAFDNLVEELLIEDWRSHHACG